jgi:hypothetical protein
MHRIVYYDYTTIQLSDCGFPLTLPERTYASIVADRSGCLIQLAPTLPEHDARDRQASRTKHDERLDPQPAFEDRANPSQTNLRGHLRTELHARSQYQ